METPEVKWYETDVMRAIQEQFEEVATKLCDEAQQQGLELPFQIDFTDDRQQLAQFEMEEDSGAWTWPRGARNGDIQNPVTAVLYGGGKGYPRLTEIFTCEG